MLASAEFLWRVNQDYVNRLAKARNYLDLLEQLVLERSELETQDRLLPTLQFTRTHLTDLSAEQHNWCYRYFYNSPVTKRIVQTPNAVQSALTSFGINVRAASQYLWRFSLTANQFTPSQSCCDSRPQWRPVGNGTLRPQ